MSMLLRLTSALTGRKAGADRFGNVYFEGRRDLAVYGRKRRWVVFAGPADPTMVPPEWHCWLHHTTAAPLSEVRRYPWQLEHQRNLTGTAQSYRPSGHDYAGGVRQVAGGDYEAWTPGA